jgi:hypothetical protein
MFYTQSTAFLEAESFLHASGGNCPILVADDGSVRQIAFNENVEEIAGEPRFPQ